MHVVVTELKHYKANNPIGDCLKLTVTADMNSFTFVYLSRGSTLQVSFRLRSELKPSALMETIAKSQLFLKEKVWVSVH